MSRQFYNLPSLNALATFEAVARNQSLTQAARELGVTTGAVSRQIKLLEKHLGLALLIRRHKNIQCNHNGQALYESLRLSFANLNQTIQSLTAQTDDLSFTLGSTTAFSSLWLMPKLSQFWKKHAQVRINLNLSDNSLDSMDHATDISIHYGTGNKPGCTVHLLFSDKIYPVCSKRMAHKYRAVNSPQQLADLPLLQLHHNDRSWTNWQRWLSHFNIETKLTNIHSFNNYLIALQAAQDDRGVLLGWHRLVSPLINEAKLYPLLKHSVDSPLSYHLYVPTDRKLNTGTRLFVEWLLENCKLD